MKLKKFKVVERTPTKVQYAFYEVEVNGELDEGDDLYQVIESVKSSLKWKTPEAPAAETPTAATKKKTTKKKATTVRVPKHLLYDREKKEHKKEFIEILFLYNAKWNEDKALVKKAGTVSKGLEGKQIFDKDGELLGSFTDLVVEQMDKD